MLFFPIAEPFAPSVLANNKCREYDEPWQLSYHIDKVVSGRPIDVALLESRATKRLGGKTLNNPSTDLG